jgi:hypothetical protein
LVSLTGSNPGGGKSLMKGRNPLAWSFRGRRRVAPAVIKEAI